MASPSRRLALGRWYRCVVELHADERGRVTAALAPPGRLTSKLSWLITGGAAGAARECR
jgi:hypothetical protein